MRVPDSSLPSSSSGEAPPGLPASSDVSSPVLTVEWEMMDKRKYIPLSTLSHFSVRCFLFPLAVIRTRLQVQVHKHHYTGTYDAFKKILRHEGPRGLYSGFWISAFQMASGVCYVSTYEGVRHILETNKITNNSIIKSFCGGLCASVVGQTINVPFDVVSQHLMILGQRRQPGSFNLSETNPLQISIFDRSRAQLSKDIIVSIYQRDGFRGFYRGYTASLCTYVPSGASWWAFYDIFQKLYAHMVPDNTAHMTLQTISAMSAGASSSVITNPLDLLRARVQIHRTSIPDTMSKLWREEGMAVFTKGLTARMSASVIYSIAVIFGYETVKRFSVYDEYKTRVKW
ncbi:solute carrier family 25 member 44 [Lepeophtheirus salmonis]|uniref:solute carrier family 25 member 44 n=1 Tax=Lepeophtheirus salmonis TaxID=72036 RepID=UPI001AE9D968|nr:solute carrier family 25 member 44-like [Lepeophtheirus salmonis]